jgi:protein-ribulosamine 3-kinase
MDWESVERGISDATGKAFIVERAQSIGGGCINAAFVLRGNDQQYFVKQNRADLAIMFQAEAAGLQALAQSAVIRVPSPVAVGADEKASWLAMEFIEMGPALPASNLKLGEALARLHRSTAEQFGWHRSNFIGANEQVNNWTDNWPEFFARHRLGFQLDLARNNGASTALLDAGNRLIEGLPRFFSAYQPLPSLLHGDLWGGNWGADSKGDPVLFDPAVYYGDREADLAMTELFGGFDDRFYQSYRGCWDIDPGYTTRKVLYNLYHVLNHYNLFGGGYASQALDMIKQLNAEVS